MLNKSFAAKAGLLGLIIPLLACSTLADLNLESPTAEPTAPLIVPTIETPASGTDAADLSESVVPEKPTDTVQYLVRVQPPEHPMSVAIPSGWAAEFGSADAATVVAATSPDGSAAFAINQKGRNYRLDWRVAPVNGADEIETAVNASIRVEPNDLPSYDRDNAVVYSSGEPTTLDPALTHSGGGGMIGDLFSGLVVMDPDLQVRPALAETWDISPDGLTYTFYLREDAKFHNGRPVTAYDVLFSWERAASPELESQTVLTYLDDIEGLEAFHAGETDTIAGLELIDLYTISVTLDAPKPYFLAKLTYPTSWIVDEYNVTQPEWEAQPNGTGPFRQQVHVNETVLILERNPFYYDAPAKLDEIVYLMYAGYSGRLYQNDEVDFTFISDTQVERATDPDDLLYGAVYSYTGLCTSYITLNTALPPLDDPKVRQALALAIDFDLMHEAIFDNESARPRGIIPPGIAGATDAVTPPSYDPERARQLLAESTYAGEVPTLVWTVGSSSGSIGGLTALMADMWERELGIEVQFNGYDWQDLWVEVDEGNYDHLLSEGWCADYPDPENFLDVLFHSSRPRNHAHYQNAEFDSLLEAARIEQDTTARLDLYAQAEQILLNEAPAIVVSHSGPSFLVWKPYVRGFTATPIGVPQNHLIWIER